MNQSTDNIQLKQKADNVCSMILSISDLTTEELRKNIKEIGNLSEEDMRKVHFIVTYTLLLQAQKLFWESVIKDQNRAHTFEIMLFETFAKKTGIDARPFVKDYADYVTKGEKSREVQYIGSKICREIKREDAFLMLEIATVFSSIMLHIFYPSMKKVWDQQ